MKIRESRRVVLQNAGLTFSSGDTLHDLKSRLHDNGLAVEQDAVMIKRSALDKLNAVVKSSR